MTSFSLYQRPSDLRIILDRSERVPAGAVVEKEIKASSWIDARMKINDIGYFIDPCHGWFIEPRQGALQMARYYRSCEDRWKEHTRAVIASLQDIKNPQQVAYDNKTRGKGKKVGQFA